VIAPLAVAALRRPTARLRLVCLPYAGGNAAAFSRWNAFLPEELELVAIELPGHGVLRHHRPCHDIAPLLDQLAAVLASLDDKPYVLFGHSLGGLLAYAVSHVAKAAEQQTAAHIVLSGCRPPHLPNQARALVDSSEAEFHDHLKARNSIPDALFDDRPFIAQFMQIMRADFALIASYVAPRCAPLDVPTTVFAGTQDSVAPARDLERWRELIETEAAMHYFEGDHFFIHKREDLVMATISALCLETLYDGSVFMRAPAPATPPHS
jgi:medium-chain acyl-[acyl-carrier-protein] hydrolase